MIYIFVIKNKIHLYVKAFKYMLGYAEIHYRPCFFPSFLNRRMPEILFDAPRRVDPGTSIPIGLIIKDAHRFPINIENVIIHMIYGDATERVARFPYTNMRIDDPLWWDLFNIIPERSGRIQITPYLEYTITGKRRIVTVDGYDNLSHAPLQVYASPEALPGFPGWFHGDIHCHTEYTEDQIEFGAPLGLITNAAKSLGLDWIATADHSYDLDDKPGSWTEKDPLLTKWESLRQSAVAEEYPVTVLAGEEVSCRGENGGNHHLLCIGNKNYIRGAGDSGENVMNNSSEHSIRNAVDTCISSGGIACAAHPYERAGIMEKLILNRKTWSIKDIRTEGLCALQFHNGIRDTGFYEGKKQWIKLLLEGRRIYAFGGNDSHGDMNRRRSIAIPLFSLSENTSHLLGTVRTVVRAQTSAGSDILDGLRHGRAIVTDGPFINVKMVSGDKEYEPGETAQPGKHTVVAECYSSQEFGLISSVRIITGRKGESGEHIYLSDIISNMSCKRKMECDIQADSYIRAECVTGKGFMGITNPIWIKHH